MHGAAKMYLDENCNLSDTIYLTFYHGIRPISDYPHEFSAYTNAYKILII